MKRGFLIAMLALLLFAGCKDTDNASKWVGTYNASAGGSQANTGNQIVVQENSSTTLRMFLNDTVYAQVVTYAILQNVVLSGNVSGSVYETDSVLGLSHPLLLNGSVTLNGNILTVTAKGTNAFDTTSIYFYGTKQ